MAARVLPYRSPLPLLQFSLRKLDSLTGKTYISIHRATHQRSKMMNYDNLVSKMLGEMSENEAIAVAKTQWWIDIGIVKAAWLQLHQRRPCMPPAEFHKGVELLLGRSVLIDEILSNQQALINEVLAGNSPSLHEIMLFMLSQLP